jgi:hypothetical protein
MRSDATSSQAAASKRCRCVLVNNSISQCLQSASDKKGKLRNAFTPIPAARSIGTAFNTFKTLGTSHSGVAVGWYESDLRSGETRLRDGCESRLECARAKTTPIDPMPDTLFSLRFDSVLTPFVTRRESSRVISNCGRNEIGLVFSAV